jgi:hypothetical protein
MNALRRKIYYNRPSISRCCEMRTRRHCTGAEAEAEEDFIVSQRLEVEDTQWRGVSDCVCVCVCVCV